MRRREAFIAERRTAREPIEGYGRPHDGLDPRAHLLLSIAKEQGVYGDHCLLAESIEAELEAAAGRRIGINIDGVSAALLSDLDPRQARPILIAPRTLSLAAHFIEQQDQGNKWRHVPRKPGHIQHLFNRRQLYGQLDVRCHAHVKIAMPRRTRRTPKEAHYDSGNQQC